MLNRDDAYHQSIEQPYELLVSKEDLDGNIPAAIAEIVDVTGKDVVDIGAGTGRLACMLAPNARRLTAVDFAADMLRIAADKLTGMGLSNWKVAVADSRQLPLEDRSADVVTAGWSICYLGSSNQAEWEADLRRVMDEIDRILKPGGTVIIFETLGTGNEEPAVPASLASYYGALVEQYGFRYRWIRTDYRFDSPDQAERLCRDFFGDELGDRIREGQSSVVPECTGIWWKTKPTNGSGESQ